MTAAQENRFSDFRDRKSLIGDSLIHFLSICKEKFCETCVHFFRKRRKQNG